MRAVSEIDNLIQWSQGFDSKKAQSLALIDHPLLIEFRRAFPSVFLEIERLSFDQRLILYKLIVMGQAKALSFELGDEQKLSKLATDLLALEECYGDLFAYQKLALSAQNRQENKEKLSPLEAKVLQEDGFDVRKAFWQGIDQAHLFGEVALVGGAAERLSLKEEKSGAPLPALFLNVQGGDLLSHLIFDLEARERLYFERTKKPLRIPLALMSSKIYQGKERLLKLLEERNWYNRERDDFMLFEQPSVPAMDREGVWASSGVCEPLWMPSGHGALWSELLRAKVFDWFVAKGKSHLLIRQINNPMAGRDRTLALFMGAALESQKSFGLLGVPAKKGYSEGSLFLAENERGGRSLVNVEYTDLREGLGEVANTNLCFVELKKVQELIESGVALPTELNFKADKPYARPETRLQDLGRFFPDDFFVMVAPRERAMSVTKRLYSEGGVFQESEACFCYEHYLETIRLLSDRCHFKLPPSYLPEQFLERGPFFLFTYHPSLGPSYEIIAQKLCGGRIAPHSELRANISDLYIENLDLAGSLLIEGHFPDNPPACHLENVTVRNFGYGEESLSALWRESFTRSEALEIIMEPASELVVKDCLFEGPMKIHVKRGTRKKIFSREGRLFFVTEPLEKERSPFYKLKVCPNQFNARLLR